MPRPQPQPPEAASAFDHLLRELSAEFERLRQQNLELASRCGELPAAGGAPKKDVQPDCDQPWPSPQGSGKAKADLGLSTSAEKAVGANQTPELALQRQGSGQRLVLQTQEPGVPAPTLQTQGSAVQSTFSMRSAWHESLRTSRSLVNVNAGVVTPKNLYEQFRFLDGDDVGRLFIDDLRRILTAANENVTQEGLINLVRIANELEPLLLNSGDGEASVTASELEEHTEDMESLGIDYWAFARVMTEDPVLWEQYPRSAEECFLAFRRACMPKVKKAQNIHCPPPPVKPTGPSAMHKVTAFWLETIPTFVILVNALVTGISADHPEQEQLWDIFEYVFGTFYLIEFIVKVWLYGLKDYFCGRERWWNFFDFSCLLMSLGDMFSKVVLALFANSVPSSDLGPVMLIKIFRLARLARLVRTLRFKIFHELKSMVLGVYSGLRVLTWAIVLLVVLVYVFGVASTNLFGNTEEEFKTVLRAMFTQFRCWTEGCAAYDGTPLAERLRERHGAIFMVYYILLTMFVTVGLFNLIMAMFIDNVMTTQTQRKHKEMAEKTQEIEQKFKRLFYELIKNGVEAKRHDHSLYKRVFREFETMGSPTRATARRASLDSGFEMEWEKLRQMDMTITRDVFRAWLHDPDFLSLLDEAEIETTNHIELFDVLDVDMSGDLSMSELTHGLMKLRGPVTKADIVAVRLKMRHIQSIMERTSNI